MYGLGSRIDVRIWFAALLLVVIMAGYGEPIAAQGDQGTTAIPSQTQGTGQMRRAIPGVKLKKLEEKLSLNAEQRKGKQALVDNELEQMKVLREDRSLTKKQRLEKFRQIREETHDKFKELLTPEQQKIYEETSAKERKFREKLRQEKSEKPLQ
jgi:hypothetical protein